MISEKMKVMTANGSAVRALFEEGKKMAAKVGPENVFDFSLGNPNIPAPVNVKDAIIDLVNEEESINIHGYMSNTGYEEVREQIAQSINKEFNTKFDQKNIIMCVGAAGGMNVMMKTLINPGDEVVVIAPYFMEYRSYAANYDATIVEVEPDTKTFQPNFEDLEKKLSPKTKVVIINNPNNPSGAIYSTETIKKLGELLAAKEKEFNTSIYLFADEPYRDLAYDGIEVPYVTPYYHNSIVIYSYSKSLSLPGERIGYIVLPYELDDYQDIFDAAAVATRILGFVNAPSLLQKVVARCLDCKADISFYDKNRQLLYNGLTKLGFECVKPDGAFYLFMKAPVEDDMEFVNEAKKHNILLVPGRSFACPGYVRIAYCVSPDLIERSMAKFKELAEVYFK